MWTGWESNPCPLRDSRSVYNHSRRFGTDTYLSIGMSRPSLLDSARHWTPSRLAAPEHPFQVTYRRLLLRWAMLRTDALNGQVRGNVFCHRVNVKVGDYHCRAVEAVAANARLRDLRLETSKPYPAQAAAVRPDAAGSLPPTAGLHRHICTPLYSVESPVFRG
ncbi:hypothetical protein [Salinibacter virus M31CR41-3]|nr:hypothetical protein [Salinibacter virus M31CR41-3]